MYEYFLPGLVGAVIGAGITMLMVKIVGYAVVRTEEVPVYINLGEDEELENDELDDRIQKILLEQVKQFGEE